MFGPSQMGTVTATRKRAYPDSLMDASTNYLTGLLQGDYLTGGPGFNAAMDAAANDIQPRVQSAFNSAGRLNSGLAQTAMTGELADAFAKLYGNERQLQSLAALQTNPVTETSETPYFGNPLSEALGIGSSLIGLGQGLFGGGDGGLVGNLSDWLGGAGSSLGSLGSVGGAVGGGAFDFLGGGGNSMTTPASGGAFDFSGAGGGVGNAGGGGGLPTTPPGASNAMSFGSGPSVFNPASYFGITSGVPFGAGATLPIGAAGAGTGAASTGLATSALGLELGAPGVGAAGASGAAGGGALAGGLGTALGAAAPLALAGFGAMSVRQKADAQKKYLEPILNNLYQNRGQTTTVNGVKGTPFQTPDGKTYLASPSAANPDNKGNGRALYGVYDPSTGQYGSISMNGFWTDPVVSATVQNTFKPGSVSKDNIYQMRDDQMQKLLASGARSFGD